MRIRRRHRLCGQAAGGRRHSGGFSLVELMVTIMIITIGLWGVGGLFLAGYKAQVYAHYTVLATEAAQQQLELERARDYFSTRADYENGLYPKSFTPSNFPARVPASGTSNAEPWNAVTNVKDINEEMLLKLTAVVSWKAGANPDAPQGRSTITALRTPHE